MSGSGGVEHVHRGYRLSIGYGHLEARERDEIIGMWVTAGVLPPPEAQRRVAEVVLTARDPSGSLAGVNTVYVAAVPGASGPYYFYRTFLRPAHRGVWGLAATMFRLALRFLAEYPHPQRPLGLVAVIENPKLAHPRIARRLRRLGLHHLGRDSNGREVWCARFDGSVPKMPSGL